MFTSEILYFFFSPTHYAHLANDRKAIAVILTKKQLYFSMAVHVQVRVLVPALSCLLKQWGYLLWKLRYNQKILTLREEHDPLQNPKIQ